MKKDQQTRPRPRQQTMIRLLPKVKQAAFRAAADEDRSLSGYIEELLAERLKETGYLK